MCEQCHFRSQLHLTVNRAIITVRSISLTLTDYNRACNACHWLVSIIATHWKHILSNDSLWFLLSTVFICERSRAELVDRRQQLRRWRHLDSTGRTRSERRDVRRRTAVFTRATSGGRRQRPAVGRPLESAHLHSSSSYRRHRSVSSTGASSRRVPSLHPSIPATSAGRLHHLRHRTG